jgi:hypothetical protein
MNNEPVAWMHKTYFLNGLYEEDLVWSKVDESSIPLYTHAAKEYKPNQTLECSFNLAGFKPPAKTLTDEEILSLTGFKDNPYDIFIEYEKEDLIEFARAILRKAQEK